MGRSGPDTRQPSSYQEPGCQLTRRAASGETEGEVYLAGARVFNLKEVEMRPHYPGSDDVQRWRAWWLLLPRSLIRLLLAKR